MYEHGIRVTYTLTRPGDGVVTMGGETEPRTLDLPGWCAGEPRLAVALYLHGTRDAERDVRLIDWQPLDAPADDADERGKPLCRCGHPVATHGRTGCRRRCGCTRTPA